MALAWLPFPTHSLILHPQVHICELKKGNFDGPSSCQATCEQLCPGSQVCISIQEAVEELEKLLSALLGLIMKSSSFGVTL